ncbi:MAG: hypothetical protein JOZ41_00390 [Chloroflexi bacterium]|nr:hypothetical protein [Chloroflexota bacterium]
MTVSREQVAQAAAALAAETRRLADEAGLTEELLESGSGPILPRFEVVWAGLMPGRVREDALGAVYGFCETIDLAPEILDCDRVPGAADLWYIRFRTPLDVPSDRAAEALLRFLSRFPMYNGSPRVGTPLLWPDGRFHCRGSIAFVDGLLGLQKRLKTAFEGLQLWFELTNVGGLDPFPAIRQVGRLFRQ